jgi:hypothetical protein
MQTLSILCCIRYEYVSNLALLSTILTEEFLGLSEFIQESTEKFP